jgi:GntR family transcriptional regulator
MIALSIRNQKRISGPGSVGRLCVQRIQDGGEMGEMAKTLKSPQSRLFPLYHQIYLTLKNELLSGHYNPSDGEAPRPIPGEIELTELYSASRVTIRRALKELENDGLIIKRHGAGTFPAPITHGRDRGDVDHLYDDLSGLVDGYESEVLLLRMIPTPLFVLAQAPDFSGECLHMNMLSRRGGKPVHLNNQYIPKAFADRIDTSRAGAIPLLLLLQKQGVSSKTTDLSLTATAADIHSAAHLDVMAGTPLISTKRTSIDAEGKSIEYFEALTRPDLYGYKFRFAG